MANFISRGFERRRQTPAELADRVPPGQYVERGFPVLTAGPTPHVETESWQFRVDGMVGEERAWDWAQFHELPFETVPCDIHCVTKWSKLGTSFGGVSVDTLLDGVDLHGGYTMAYSYGGYTTNLAIADLPREHGGPARLLVPHLYFWKSAKWVAGLRVLDHEEPGFWEENGYHIRGDPWKEERYWND
jgi:DMSO/TMAO reductase YedYZ molybdopterin-dependent catalytic subunit